MPASAIATVPALIETLVAPTPPVASEALPHVGAGLRLLDNPTDYLAELRARHGDTFLLDVFGFPLFVTFSAKGLNTLYKLAEDEASFGLATFDLLGFKTPDEVFADASTDLFYAMLAQRHMQTYVERIDAVVVEHLDGWGENIDLFDAIRTLEQRIGYALWIAPEAAGPRWWPQLKAQFDRIDQERAFVDPHAALVTIKTGKAAERAAVAEIGLLVDAIAIERDATTPTGPPAAIDTLRERFAGDAPDVARRKLVHSVVNLNNGFLSNLYAAIGWMLVHVVLRDDVRSRVVGEIAEARVRSGSGFTRSAAALDRMAALEELMMESVRLAQSSITLRKVMTPIDFDDGNRVYRIQPGVYITTMLSVGNRRTPELRRFDLTNYRRMRPTGRLTEEGAETISTFGHGQHACPALRFSHYMAKIVVTHILDRFGLEPAFDAARPAARQLGGVARPEDRLIVRLTSR